MDDARRALLTGLFDHAPTFPPASLPLEEALAEDERARRSEHAWLLGRLVVREGTEVPGRELALVSPGVERHDEAEYLEGVPLDEVAARGVRAKVRCGGERVPPVQELAAFVRGCRERGIVFKATAGLHHAYPTAEGEHGFLNLLAAAVFGDEEEALAARPGAFELDAASFRWEGREADARRLADVRASLFNSIGSCSFFEPVEELVALGVLP
ncbi:MAG TPA: hypothetical protein VHD91_10555 [Gaiellaceae bacterium]|nr:hypothetical protein [Gaiellaceae bacterium]